MKDQAESYFMTTRRTQVDQAQKTKHKALENGSLGDRQLAMKAQEPEVKFPALRKKLDMAAHLSNYNPEEQRLVDPGTSLASHSRYCDSYVQLANLLQGKKWSPIEKEI